MKIKKIHLRNFKNFEDVTVALGDMNVLIGANASGKSNFLSALKFLRDIQQFGMEDAVSLQGGIEYIGRFGMKEGDEIVIGMEVDLDLDVMEHHRITDVAVPLISGIIYELKIILCPHSKYELKEMVKYRMNAAPRSRGLAGLSEIGSSLLRQDLFIPYQYIIVRSTIDGIYIENHDEKVFLPHINEAVYVMELAPFDEYKTEADQLLIEGFIRSLSLEQLSIYDFDPKLIKQPTSMLSKAKLEENGSNLAVVLKKLLANPEKSKSLIRMTKYLLRFVTNVTVEKSLNKSLQFSINESHNADVNLPNFLLSDGTVTAMATLVGLAYEANKVVIFEEPERGIHPELISSLMGLFYDITTETRKKQVIITTHNPTWLNHAKVEDILIFERNKQGTCEISTIKDRDMVKRFLKKGSMIGHLFAQNLLNS